MKTQEEGAGTLAELPRAGGPRWDWQLLAVPRLPSRRGAGRPALLRVAVMQRPRGAVGTAAARAAASPHQH